MGQRRNQSRPERPQPQPPHTRYSTFHRQLQPLYTEKRKVSCSGFLPNTSPMQHFMQHHDAAIKITIRFAASRSKPASLYTRMATPDDNNHAAIPMRSATTNSRNAKIYAHRHNHSLQNTEEEAIASGNDRSRNSPHTRGTFHRRLQPLYTGKHKVSCSGFLPNTTPMQHSCRSISFVVYCFVV